jgi:hypothetical protein
MTNFPESVIKAAKEKENELDAKRKHKREMTKEEVCFRMIF